MIKEIRHQGKSEYAYTSWFPIGCNMSLNMDIFYYTSFSLYHQEISIKLLTYISLPGSLGINNEKSYARLPGIYKDFYSFRD